MKIDLQVAANRPAERLEFFAERRSANLSLRIALGVEHQHRDPPHPLGQLRTRRHRPSDYRATG